MRSRSTISSTTPASNTASGKIVAPRMRHARHPALYPKMWKNGFAIRYRSPARRSAQSHQSRYARIVGTDGGDASVELRFGHCVSPSNEVVPGRRRGIGLTGEQDRLLERGEL